MKNVTFKEAFQYNCNDQIDISPSFSETVFSSTNLIDETPKITPYNKLTHSEMFTILPTAQ